MYGPTEETLPLSTSDIDIGRIAKNLHERLENVENDKLNLQEQLLDSKEKQSELGIENDRLHKRIITLQQDLNTYINNQSRLEVHHYTQEQELTDLRKEVTQLTKEKNDLQKKLKLELDTFENNQLKWEQREETLCKQIRRLTETERALQNNNIIRSSSINNNSKNNNSSKKKQKSIESTLSSSSSPSSYSLSSNPVIINNTNNTITTRRTCSIRSSHERQVTELNQQLKSQETRLVKELEDQDKRHSKRIRKLITEISNMKQINQSLMEENEGYQSLLNEKTMNGSFLLLGDKQDSTRKEDYNCNGTMVTGFSNLAAELHNVSTATINSSFSTSSTSSSSNGSGSGTSSNGDTKQPQNQNSAELYSEIKSLKDANHALNLYINKILIKIIENEDLEYLLSVDQQQQQGQRVTFSQLDNNDNDTNTPSSNQIHNNNISNNPPIMRKSFSSTMLSKILRRRRQNDQEHEQQQINLKIQDNISIAKSLLSVPFKHIIPAAPAPVPAPAAPETSNNNEGRSQCKEELLIKRPSITG